MDKLIYVSAAMLVLVITAAVYIDYSITSPPKTHVRMQAEGGEAYPRTLGIDPRMLYPSIVEANRTLATLYSENNRPVYIPSWIYIYPPSLALSVEKQVEPPRTSTQGEGVLLETKDEIYIRVPSVTAVVNDRCIYKVRISEETPYGPMSQEVLYANCSDAVLRIKPVEMEESIPSTPLDKYISQAKKSLGSQYKLYTAVPVRDKAFLDSMMKYIVRTNEGSLKSIVENILNYIRSNTRYERTAFSLDAPARSLLLEGKGDCFKASLAFTNMLRYLGIPARPVTGYYISGYTPAGTGYKADITAKNLHMWVEVYSGDNWIPVDPTPPARPLYTPSASQSPVSPLEAGIAQEGGKEVGGQQASQQAVPTISGTDISESSLTKPISQILGSTASNTQRTPVPEDKQHRRIKAGYYSVAIIIVAAAALLIAAEHVRREQEAAIVAGIGEPASPLKRISRAKSLLKEHLVKEALREAYMALRDVLREHIPVMPSDTAREVLLVKLPVAIGQAFPHTLVELLERVLYGGKPADRDEAEEWLREAERIAERLAG